jgi:F-type H+-transporting ATPase subunit gamma
VENSRPYVREFTNVLAQAAKAAATDHPLLVARENVSRVGVLVITSDRGLAGGYNANTLRLANQRLGELADAGHEPVLFVVGRKGRDFFRFRGRDAAQSWTGFSEQPGYENAVEVADSLAAAFLAGGDGTIEGPGEDEDPPVIAPEEMRGLNGVDEIHIVFTAFETMLSQTPEARQIAPLSLEELDSGDSEDSDDSSEDDSEAEYDFEPDAEQLFDVLLPKYLRTRVFAAMLDAAASESAARRRAMKAATDNANELIDNLTREANQARQAQITQEISEIVGGADALASQGSD